MNSSSTTPLLFDQKAVLLKFDPESNIKLYLQLLESENQKINLVSRETSPSDLEKLAAESVFPFEIIKAGSISSYLDIGSGGGFPAFPIIMCTDPKNSVLVERTKKKAVVLNRMSQELGLNVEVLDQNFEECDFESKFNLITLRLVKLNLPLLKKIAALLTPPGHFVYYSKFVEKSAIKNIKKSEYTFTSTSGGPLKAFTIFSKQSG
ncbi:MAG TPA: RsmG family class I SAM-dependent methyltransferase [candidate division Zixibacteria bacterium]|nr:RsmG family class I SAM-dependent methyltransferase [candidate division Zixibacteria bacterium]